MNSKLTYLFKVTLLDNIVISASTASAGDHESLDYLPGSLFLGATALKLYDQLNQEQAFKVFHSGDFIFNDGLPVIDGLPTYPMPLSFHHFKNETYFKKETHQLMGEQINNLIIQLPKDETQSKQPKQIRKDYLTESGLLFKPKRSLRMMTAIDAKTATAANGQLFGYQSLDADQVYYFSFNAPKEQSELAEIIAKNIEGELRLGRSRGAHYGRVEVERIHTQQPILPQTLTDSKPHELTLWLLSDLALIDKQGNPTLQPYPVLLNLPEDTTWESKKSFIRYRNLSLFNGYRKNFDQERAVISRGSVLCFSLKRALSEQELANLNQLGRYQEYGLGKIAVNPKLLTEKNPVFSSDLKPLFAQNAIKIDWNQVSQHPLAQLVQRKVELVYLTRLIEQTAKDVFKKIEKEVMTIRRRLGLSEKNVLPNAPTKTQWGNIRAVANDLRNDSAQLMNQLFNETDGIIRKRSGWDLKIGFKNFLYTSMHQLLTETKDKFNSDPAKFSSFVGYLAQLGSSNRWSDLIEGRLDRYFDEQQNQKENQNVN